MMFRYLSRPLLSACLLAALPITVAQAVTAPASPSASPATDATRLANLKSRGTTEIDRRTQNLSAALAKLSASTRLTAADQAALTKQLNDEVAALTALKTKLAGETTLAAARADVQSVVTDYRVYALMLPKARLTASADRFAAAETKLTALHDKLAAAITNKPDLKAKLDDMAAKVADAKTKSGSVVAQVLALMPTDYNANHTVLLQYRASLKAAQDDLVAARADAKAITDALGH